MGNVSSGSAKFGDFTGLERQGEPLREEREEAPVLESLEAVADDDRGAGLSLARAGPDVHVQRPAVRSDELEPR